MDETQENEEIETDAIGKEYESAVGQLVPKRRAFVEQYMIDLNATQAAIRAGYGIKGAHTEGWRLLRDAKVHKAILAGLAEMRERSHIAVAWVHEGLKRNVRNAWDKGDTQAANRALQLLGKSLGMFSEDLNVNLNATSTAKVVMYFPDNGRGPAAESERPPTPQLPPNRIIREDKAKPEGET